MLSATASVNTPFVSDIQDFFDGRYPDHMDCKTFFGIDTYKLTLYISLSNEEKRMQFLLVKHF